MKFINLTNQTIRLYDDTGRRVLLELPTDPPAVTAQVIPEVVDEILDDETGKFVVVVRHIYSIVGTLPKPKPDTMYVVGWAVLLALADEKKPRSDLIAPDTSRESAVRDANGRIVGVRRFRVI